MERASNCDQLGSLNNKTPEAGARRLAACELRHLPPNNHHNDHESRDNHHHHSVDNDVDSNDDDEGNRCKRMTLDC